MNPRLPLLLKPCPTQVYALPRGPAGSLAPVAEVPAAQAVAARLAHDQP